MLTAALINIFDVILLYYVKRLMSSEKIITQLSISPELHLEHLSAHCFGSAYLLF